MAKRFPESSCTFKNNTMTWIGKLKPSPLSQEYEVRLRYKLGESPKVDLVTPKLERRDGKLPPHLYPGERLCLYLPRKYEWNADMLLVESIVPWASEWLLHYEYWLGTGEWYGGGEHPGDEPKVEPARRNEDDNVRSNPRHSR